MPAGKTSIAIPQLAQGFRNRRSFKLVAPVLECSSRADQHCAFDFGPIRHGKGGHIRAKIRIIRVISVVYGIFRNGRYISFFHR